MMKKAVMMLLALGAIGQVSAQEPQLLARFKGGIGVIPASSGIGAVDNNGVSPDVRRNIVRGVLPGAGPWTIADLRADVDVFGRVEVRGRGLLLASGDSLGQTLNLSVGASLICEASAPFVAHTTVAVPLEPNGDFRIVDTLTTVPSACPSPVLLIRVGGTGPWLAAGIPDLPGSDK